MKRSTRNLSVTFLALLLSLWASESLEALGDGPGDRCNACVESCEEGLAAACQEQCGDPEEEDIWVADSCNSNGCGFQYESAECVKFEI